MSFANVSSPQVTHSAPTPSVDYVRQKYIWYSGLYKMQACPLLGMIPSVVAVASAALHGLGALFSYAVCANQEAASDHWQMAYSLGHVVVDNIVNIFTFGIKNALRGSQSPLESVRNEETPGRAESKKMLCMKAGRTFAILQCDGQYGRKGGRIEIELKEPVYMFPSMCVQGMMTEPAPVMDVSIGDFSILQSVCHEGAFGGDYAQSTTDHSRMLVWKIPADLLHIGAWEALPLKFSVGTYRMHISFEYKPLPNPVLESIAGKQSTKVRIDVRTMDSNEKITVNSVHYLTVERAEEGGTSCRLPAISMSHFARDFDQLQDEEEKAMRTLCADLEQVGVFAFPCQTQHVIVVYGLVDQAGQIKTITLEACANKLQEKRVFELIQKAARLVSEGERYNMQPWRDMFVAQFG